MFNRLPTSRRASLLNMPRRKFASAITQHPKKYEPFSIEQIGAYLASQVQHEFEIYQIDAGVGGRDLIIISGSFTGPHVMTDVQVQIEIFKDHCKLYCSAGATTNRVEWQPQALIDMWSGCGLKLYKLVDATLNTL